MAFEQPVEADQVDLNLGSILSRAPIIGSFMFLFGVDRAKQEEEERQQIMASASSSSSDDCNDNDRVSTTMLHHHTHYNKKPRKSALKKTPPSLVGSVISDIGECSEALEGMHLVVNNNNKDDSESSSSSTLTTCLSQKKRKSLSWSDQSGQNLVEYVCQEVSRA